MFIILADFSYFGITAQSFITFNSSTVIGWNIPHPNSTSSIVTDDLERWRMQRHTITVEPRQHQHMLLNVMFIGYCFRVIACKFKIQKNVSPPQPQTQNQKSIAVYTPYLHQNKTKLTKVTKADKRIFGSTSSLSGLQTVQWPERLQMHNTWIVSHSHVCIHESAKARYLKVFVVSIWHLLLLASHDAAFDPWICPRRWIPPPCGTNQRAHSHGLRPHSLPALCPQRPSVPSPPDLPPPLYPGLLSLSERQRLLGWYLHDTVVIPLF